MPPTDCPAGQEYDESTSACTDCAVNHYSTGGTDACKACPSGYESAAGAAYCHCYAGLILLKKKHDGQLSEIYPLCPPANGELKFVENLHYTTYDLNHQADQGSHGGKDKGLTLPDGKTIGNDDFFDSTDQLDVFGNAFITLFAYQDIENKHNKAKTFYEGQYDLTSTPWLGSRMWSKNIQSIEFQTTCPVPAPPHVILPGAFPTEGYDCSPSSGTVI